jgi:hypothetical protein
MKVISKQQKLLFKKKVKNWMDGNDPNRKFTQVLDDFPNWKHYFPLEVTVADYFGHSNYRILIKYIEQSNRWEIIDL